VSFYDDAARIDAALEQRKAAAVPKGPVLGQRVAGLTPLYDPKTGQLVPLDGEAASKSAAAGTAVPQADARVNVIGPNGERGSVPGTELQQAIQTGFRLETSQEQRIGDYLQANSGSTGAAKVGVGKALSELAFGVPEIAYQHLAPKEDVEEWEALKEAHPVASGVGSAVGFGGSMLYGGPLFQAASKAGKVAEGAMLAGKAGAGVARKLAASAAKMGVEGAVLSAPQVVTEAALGDPKEAAEHLAFGLGAGATLGAAGQIAHWSVKGLGKLASGALEHFGVEAGAANPLKSLSETQAFRSLMHSQDARGTKLAEQLPDGAKGLGRYVLDNDLLRQSGESFEKYAARVAERKDSVGKAIGAEYKALDAAGAVGPTADSLATRLEKEVIEPLRMKSTRRTEVARLEAFKDDFLQASRLQSDMRGAAPNSPQALADLWETRKDLSAKIYQEGKAALGNPSPIDKEFDKFRRILDDSIESSAGPKFKAEIGELNNDYRHLSTLEDIVETSVTRETKNRSLSLSDYLTGGHAGIGLAMHSPISGLGGLGVAIGHKWARENGNQLVARYADKLGTFWAHRAVTQGNKAMALVPQAFTSAALGEKSEQAALNGFHLFLGEGATSKSDEQNFHDVAQRLTEVAQNPAKAQAHVQAVGEVLANGAPQVSQAYAAHELAKAQWLWSQLPKPPPPQPFMSNEWKPTKREVHDFKDKLQVAMDPYSIVRETARGTVTPAHVAAIKAVWPASYDRMVAEVKSWGMTNAAKKLPYQKRLAIGLMVGAQTDPSLANVATYQANFASEAASASAPAPSKLGKLPGSEYTTQQRIRT
jgi:hypothetical protein